MQAKHAVASDCKYLQQCISFVRSLGTQVERFLKWDYCTCFCEKCHIRRGDEEVYERGGSKYALPIGWARVCIDNAAAEILGAFQWPVAFHGTHTDKLLNILVTGRLVAAGERVTALQGQAVGIGDGHYNLPFLRINKCSGLPEIFHPNQIFCSPTMKYCELGTYARTTDYRSPDGTNYRVQVALQVRVRPGTYRKGQQTVGAQRAIDPNFDNNEIEWYFDGQEHGSHQLTGLLVKLTIVPQSVPNADYKDGSLITYVDAVCKKAFPTLLCPHCKMHSDYPNANYMHRLVIIDL